MKLWIESKISINRDRAYFRSEQVMVAGFCEHDSELSGYIKFGEFLNSYYQLLKHSG